MKKLIFLCWILVLWGTGVQAQNGYRVTGTIKGFKAERLHLVTYHGIEPDTLGTAEVADGQFQFSGAVKEVMVAYLIPEGSRGGFQIFLEDNTNFTVTLDAVNPVANHVEGGEAQRLFNDYRAINLRVMQRQRDVQQQLGPAKANKDSVLVEKLNKEFADAYTEYQTAFADFMQRNADTYVAAYLVVSMMQQIKFEEVKKMYNNLGENARQTEMGVEVAKYIQRIESIAVGKTAPDFTLPSSDGKTVSLHSVKGKVKLLDFWASWCGPCRRENPNVVAIYKEFHDKGLEVVSVSLDNDRKEWLKAMAEDKLTWIQLSDLKGPYSPVAALYNVTSIPRTFLLDENNCIVAMNLRGDELKAAIEELLK